jgi:hypothetical protein
MAPWLVAGARWGIALQGFTDGFGGHHASSKAKIIRSVSTLLAQKKRLTIKLEM